ncbi:MAG: hypothetical protein L0Y42_03000 [Phycisphaerales bacterium]|nr:hypothetical protein [Phycisphaerales bacterium]
MLVIERWGERLMGSPNIFEPPLEIPDGYVAIPINSEDLSSAPVRLSVLVRIAPDDLGGRLVVLRETLDAQVFLGCILDAASQAVKWVEVWVQNPDGVIGSAAACREALSNAALDRRWEQFFRALSAHDRSAVVTTGWESAHPAPVVLDVGRKCAVKLMDQESGGHWELCQDDQLLAEKGLPKYGGSLARYLYVAQAKGKSGFVAVTGDAPTNAVTKALTDVVPKGNAIGFNLGGGLILVQPFSPVGIEQFLDILGGGAWSGLQHGRTAIQWRQKDRDGGAERSDGVTSNGSLFLERHGRSGRLIESLHLKLRLIADAISAVRGLVARTQAPLLNITPESFAVRLGESGLGLPYLWTSRTALKDPGTAIALPIQASDVQYFVRGGSSGVSIYQPDSAGGAVSGRGPVRIRQVINDTGGGVVVEGTLTTHERIAPARNDLLWIRLNLAGQRVDVYSRLDVDAAMASGEVRFRSVPLRFDAALVKSLRSAEGVPIANASFEIIPLLSSPCDLYSLAVLAVRALFVNGETSLPKALDEVLSLARQLALEHDESVGLRLRIQSLFDGDKRWLGSLGPHRLLHESVKPGEAFDLIPGELWWDTVGLVVRMLPGVGPDSFCLDYSDAQAGGIHKVFDGAQQELETLLVRSRSLIVIDWRFNREIHSVIRRLVAGMTGETAGKA